MVRPAQLAICSLFWRPTLILKVAGVIPGLNVPNAYGQSGQPTRPEFEVASVKPHSSSGGSPINSIARDPGLLAYMGMTVRGLIREAYGRINVYPLSLGPFGGEGAEENEVTGHGTQKPVEIMRRPILNHTRRGEGCYDPFLESGSTLIAAESTGRICYGMEIDPRYVDVAVLRWQRFTGQQAVLDGERRTFEQIGRLRRKEVA